MKRLFSILALVCLTAFCAVRAASPLGDVKVTLLVPSDCGMDISHDIYFIWKGTNLEPTDHKVKLEREKDTRYWKATVNVNDYGFTYSFTTEMSETEKAVASGDMDVFDKFTPFYCEVGPLEKTAEVAGVTIYSHYLYKSDENAKDHQCNIDQSTVSVTPAPGQITFRWLPEQDPAYTYELSIEEEGYLPITETVHEVPYVWKKSNTKDITIMKWSIQPKLSGNAVGKLYTNETVMIVPASPYFIKNINFTVGEGNKGELSFDALSAPAKVRVQVVDPNSVDVLDEELETSELAVKEGKYVILTAPLSATGTCYVYVTLYDEDDVYRDSKNQSFSITSLPEDKLGKVNVSVLIPTDFCNFDVSGGVWFCYQPTSGSENWIKATAAEGRWFTAELDVDKASYTLTVGNKDKADWKSATKTFPQLYIVAKDARFYMYWSYGNILLQEADVRMTDKDRHPADIEVATDEQNGGVTYTISGKDKAAKYELKWYEKTTDLESNSLFKYEFVPAEDAMMPLGFFMESTSKNEQKIEKMIVVAYDENGYQCCSKLEKEIAFTIPKSANVPTDVTTTQNGNSITLSWKASSGVSTYKIKAVYYSEKLKEWEINPSEQSSEDGKYSVTLDPIYGNGQYEFSIQAYVKDVYFTTVETKCDVTDRSGVNSATIRVLIPSDNNFPTTDGPTIYWWEVGQKGQFVTTTANGRWYEANIETPASAFRVLVAKKKDDFSSQTFDSHTLNGSACFELDYKTYAAKWELLDADCEAKDHNRTIDKVEWDMSVEGMVKLTITPKGENDFTPFYVLKKRKNGTSDPYATWQVLEYKGNNTFSFPSNLTANGLWDVVIEPSYSDDNVLILEADRYEKNGIAFKANPYFMTNMKAEVEKDGQTVNFFWDANSAVDHYEIEVIDNSYELRFTASSLTETKTTAKFYIPVDHRWYVKAYNSTNELMSTTEGPKFTVIAPNLCPTDLQENVATKTVTIQWDAPKDITKTRYVITNSMDNKEVASGYVTRQIDGLFTATFTYSEKKNSTFDWKVVSVAEDNTEISMTTYGASFMIDGRQADPSPETHVTLTLKAAPGGTVPSFLNGTYLKGTSVNIFAQEDDGWSFDEWSDDDSGANYRSITLTQDTVLEAFFTTYEKFSFVVSAGEGGKVNSELNGIYKGGKRLAIKATPNTGYTFSKWSDEDMNAERVYVLGKNTTLKALFAQNVTLTVEISPSEGGKVEVDGDADVSTKTVEAGKTINLSAKPAEGYEFVRYEDDGNSVTTAEYTVTMDKTKTVKAVFKAKEEEKGIENVQSDKVQCTKLLRDGQLYILYNGTMYNVQGQKVK